VNWWHEVRWLIRREAVQEWRQRTALNGLLLYVGGATYICYLSVGARAGALPIPTWNALFWLILLFSALNAAQKSFGQETPGRLLYLHTLVRPETLIVAKMLYNAGLLLGLALLAFGTFALVLGNPVADLWLFLAALGLGATGFSASLTLMSGLAAKAANSATLLAVLAFPVLIPQLLLLLRISKNALDGLDRSVSLGPLVSVLAVNVIVATLAIVLFPYLWKS
jgi:heme exporter protein B